MKKLCYCVTLVFLLVSSMFAQVTCEPGEQAISQLKFSKPDGTTSIGGCVNPSTGVFHFSTRVVWTYNDPSTTMAHNLADANFGSAANMWRKFDATNFSQFRLQNHFSAALVGSSVRLQYSTDNSTFFDAEDTTTVGALSVPTGLSTGNWAPLKLAARADVFWRFVESGGDGTTRNWVHTEIHFR
jgi:hypothetical protein